MKVAFHALGCKVNQSDIQAMAQQFTDAGWEIVPFTRQADVYVVGTCTVTAMSDRKSRQFISRAAKKGVVIATGCYAQRADEELMALGVAAVIGNHDRNRMVEVATEALKGRQQSLVTDINACGDFEEMPLTDFAQGRSRATVKVQEGCNNHCTYCIIPSVRGPARSRKISDVLRHAAYLAEAGYREIVLVGICLSAYDDEGKGLDDLLVALEEVEGIERVRLGSLEPLQVSAAFVEKLASCRKLCHHFHISLQSGSDTVLKRMGRRYTAKEFAENINALRQLKDCMITTDVIVGFSGETEEEFQTTCDYVREMKFSHVHVFPYSMRPGTPAAKLPDLPAQVKKERVRRLQSIVDGVRGDLLKGMVGKQYNVLIERTEKGKTYGLTENYIEVELDQGQVGQILPVEITGCGEILYGRLRPE